MLRKLDPVLATNPNFLLQTHSTIRPAKRAPVVKETALPTALPTAQRKYGYLWQVTIETFDVELHARTICKSGEGRITFPDAAPAAANTRCDNHSFTTVQTASTDQFTMPEMPKGIELLNVIHAGLYGPGFHENPSKGRSWVWMSQLKATQQKKQKPNFRSIWCLSRQLC